MSTPDRKTARWPKPSNEEIVHRFEHHPPRTTCDADLHAACRRTLRDAALDLVGLTPASREQSLMLTALEEAMFWANAALARNRE